MEEMGKFAGKLSQAGAMRGGAPLQPAEEGARVRIRDGKTLLTDGPFSETKESLGGYFMIECENQQEAVEWAKRCPHAKLGPRRSPRSNSDGSTAVLVPCPRSSLSNVCAFEWPVMHGDRGCGPLARRATEA